MESPLATVVNETPHFTQGRSRVWITDPLGVVVFAEAGKSVIGREIMDVFNQANEVLEDRFQQHQTKMTCIFDLWDGPPFTSAARVAVANWGLKLGKQKVKSIDILMRPTTNPLTLMGVATTRSVFMAKAIPFEIHYQSKVLAALPHIQPLRKASL